MSNEEMNQKCMFMFVVYLFIYLFIYFWRLWTGFATDRDTTLSVDHCISQLNIIVIEYMESIWNPYFF